MIHTQGKCARSQTTPLMPLPYETGQFLGFADSGTMSKRVNAASGSHARVKDPTDP
jgi:hypothetical protein